MNCFVMQKCWKLGREVYIALTVIAPGLLKADAGVRVRGEA